MAYLMTVASVSFTDLNRLVADGAHVLAPSHSDFVSHYLAYSIQAQPLGGLVAQAIDGGKIIHPDLWHPLRAPLFHSPEAVQGLYSANQAAWNVFVADHNISKDDWYRMEIEKLLTVFGYAAKCGECVASFLHPPVDAERANRVRIPLEM